MNLLLILFAAASLTEFKAHDQRTFRDLFRTPQPELRWDDEDEQEEIEAWLLPGPLPPAPMDGLPIIDFAQKRTRWET